MKQIERDDCPNVLEEWLWTSLNKEQKSSLLKSLNNNSKNKKNGNLNFKNYRDNKERTSSISQLLSRTSYEDEFGDNVVVDAQSILSKAVQCIGGHFEISCRLEKFSKELNKQVLETISQVNDAFDSIINTVNKRRNDLIFSINGSFSRQKMFLCDAKRRLQKLHITISEIEDECNTAITCQNLERITRFHSDYDVKLIKVQDCHCNMRKLIQDMENRFNLFAVFSPLQISSNTSN